MQAEQAKQMGMRPRRGVGRQWSRGFQRRADGAGADLGPQHGGRAAETHAGGEAPPPHPDRQAAGVPPEVLQRGRRRVGGGRAIWNAEAPSRRRYSAGVIAARRRKFSLKVESPS